MSVTDANKRRFDQLELHHLLLENHMKDIHSALKGLMTKAKVIADQTNRIEADLGSQRRDLEDNISNVCITISCYYIHQLALTKI